MSTSGQQKTELVGPLAVTAACAIGMLAMLGFSVDDAWIPVRYARHIADGAGYRFNSGGLATDGVTPLVWAPLLSLFAHGQSPLHVLQAARVIGAGAWLGAAFMLGRAIFASPARTMDRGVATLVVAAALPVAAHVASGMETGAAVGLATCAVCMFHRPALLVALAAGATLFRPELVVWAGALSFGVAVAKRGARTIAAVVPHALLLTAGAGVPFIATTVARLVLFGRPVPLSVLAKPSDIAHGAVYVAAAGLAALTPVLACAPLAIARTGGRSAVIAVAAIAHGLTVVALGGDWMPYGRLLAPIAPGLVLVALDAAPKAARWSRALRSSLAVALAGYLAVVAAPDGRRVLSDRAQVADAARPVFANAHVIAALDIGWPTSVFEGTMIDLAGLTDPAIAILPGGHTSKRIDPAMLLDRAPDLLVFYARGASVEDARYERVIEQRLASAELVRAHYAPRELLPLGTSGHAYIVWHRTDAER